MDILTLSKIHSKCFECKIARVVICEVLHENEVPQRIIAQLIGVSQSTVSYSITQAPNFYHLKLYQRFRKEIDLEYLLTLLEEYYVY